MKVRVLIPDDHLLDNMYFGLINEHVYTVESEYSKEILVLYNERNDITYIEKRWCEPIKEFNILLPEDIFE